ncbi:MAG: hypothetical protein WCX71_00375 [Candidatus Buchananbacteria bacterium]
MPETNAIAVMPGRIDTTGLCSACKKDVSFLFPFIENGEIPRPNYCPKCKTPFREGEIDRIILKCGNCDTKIVAPDEIIYCTGCGKKIIYPPKDDGQPND